MRMLPRQYRKTLADVMEPLNFVQDGLMSSTAWDIPVGNAKRVLHLGVRSPLGPGLRQPRPSLLSGR
jgi:hypothetical protein